VIFAILRIFWEKGVCHEVKPLHTLKRHSALWMSFQINMVDRRKKIRNPYFQIKPGKQIDAELRIIIAIGGAP